MPPGLRQGRRIATGLAIIVLLIAAGIFIFFLDRIVGSIRDTYTIVGVFFEAPRLRSGTPVRVAGFSVGEVTRIELLPPDGESIPPFAATLRLPARLRSEIRRDSRIRLQRQRLMGESVVEVTPGTAASPILQPGDTLHARPPIQTATLVAMAGALQAGLDSLLVEEQVLRERTRPLASVEERLAPALVGIRAEFREFNRQLRAGPLPEFLADTTWHAALDRIGSLVTRISELAHARAATVSDTLLRPDVDSFARRTAALQQQIAALKALLEEPRGFPGRLEEDPALRNAIAATRAALDSLIEVTRRKPWRYFF
jgi:hypothetical protein